MLRAAARLRLVRSKWTPQRQRISSTTTQRKTSTAGMVLAIGAGAVVAGSGALLWFQPNYLFAFGGRHVGNDGDDNVADDNEEVVLLRDGDDEGAEDADEEGLRVTLDFSRDRLHRVLADYGIYQSSSSLVPAQEDKTGISLVSWAAYSHQPPHINVFSWLMGLPTHTLALSHIIGGQNPRELGEMLLDAISCSVKDAVSSYDASQTFTSSPQSYSSDGEGGLSISYLEALNQEEGPTPTFTPDVVRPMISQEEIGRALKRAFIGTDYRMVYGVVERISQMSKQHKAGADMTGDAVEITKPVSSVSTALVGLYESDTKVLTLALAGDSRAVLGRPTATTPSEPIPDPTNQSETLFSTRRRAHYHTLYRAFTLTADQTPSNAEEVARLQAAHPGQQLFFNDRTTPSTAPKRKSFLGLPVTRGFGAGALKWTLDFQRTLQDDFLGDELPHFFLDGTLPGPTGVSPPDLLPQGPHPISSPAFPSGCRPPTLPQNNSSQLLTSEPEITSVRIRPGDFIVLGSKGLFECLNSEEVVGLVGVWVEERRRSAEKGGHRQHPASVRVREDATFVADDPVVELMPQMQKINTLPYEDQVQVMKMVTEHGRPRQRRLVDRAELPIIPASASDDPELAQLSRKNDSLNSARKAFRYSLSWKMNNAQFVFSERDRENVAAHILRNAVGGEREDFVRALSLMTSDQASRFVDDIGLTVIFFD